MIKFTTSAAFVAVVVAALIAEPALAEPAGSSFTVSLVARKAAQRRDVEPGVRVSCRQVRGGISGGALLPTWRWVLR